MSAPDPAAHSQTARLTIPSKLAAIPSVVQQIIDAAKQRGYSDDCVFAVRLALDEAISNAIRHGNKNDPAKPVHVDYQVNDTAITISIEDQGYGFHPHNLPDPTADENIEKPCGRGVMLIQAYMSGVQYNDRGNRITMTKRKDCTLPKR